MQKKYQVYCNISRHFQHRLLVPKFGTFNPNKDTRKDLNNLAGQWGGDLYAFSPSGLIGQLISHLPQKDREIGRSVVRNKNALFNHNQV